MWENTSTFFVRDFVKGQEWVCDNGKKVSGNGYEFYREDEHETISFFVPTHSSRRSKQRIVEHTDMILFVWEEFIQTTAYLDFVTEGTCFVLRIQDKFICPMRCTQMDQHAVRFHLHTTDRDEDRKFGFSVREDDVVIDCHPCGASVSFELADQVERYTKNAI